jgi:hypothetical protein
MTQKNLRAFSHDLMMNSRNVDLTPVAPAVGSSVRLLAHRLTHRRLWRALVHRVTDLFRDACHRENPRRARSKDIFGLAAAF